MGEIEILDVIGADFWSGGGVTPKSVKEKLDAMKDVRGIKVVINSPGGNAFDGIAIYNLLKEAGCPIDVHVLGMAASAASIVAMAGDKITMHRGSLMMIHNSSGLAIGNAADMRQLADLLEKLDGQMAGVYASRGKIDASKAAGLMAAETWMDGEEAIQAGLADAIDDGEEAAKALAVSARRIAALEGRGMKFANLPDWLAQMRAQAEESADRKGAADKSAADENEKEKEGATMPEAKEGTAETPKAATIQELKAAFPKADSDFILAQAAAGATVEAARIAWQAKLESDLDNASAAAKTPGQAPLGSGANRESSPSGDPIADWNEKIEAKMKSGMTRQKATIAVAAAHPELREAMVAEHNKANGRQRRAA